ncbi:MAG: FAD-dependent oxidoreductase [Candidatus Latescibacterota bacterium]|nr:FAD-dependent oxidoreductase [Candidatus Latescibacterota bacterium]
MTDNQVVDVQECDSLVVGGGVGGVAATLAACRAGYRVHLAEETAWLGGQMTSQGVSALDEHAHIEQFGGTRSYAAFREGVRHYYRHNLTPTGNTEGRFGYFNPGDGWVSRLCFEPKVGVGVIATMLLPYVASGALDIHYRFKPVATRVKGSRVCEVQLQRNGGSAQLAIRATYVIDATELGDLLPLTGCNWVSGAESRDQTGEPGAREQGLAPHLNQTYTYPFVVDFRAGEDHTISPPPNYEKLRDEQPFTLTLRYGTEDKTYKVFEDVPDLPGSFWAYRRILATSQFAKGEVPGDLSMINWPGNDFKGGDLITASAADRGRLLTEAKALSLSFLYWLQTEVPRDDGSGNGYPELRLRTDVLGTADGLSMYPYIRESRRIVALTTVKEQDVSAEFQDGARARRFPDSVGLGWYPIDIHGLPDDPAKGGAAKPFQIPLRSLVPRGGDNLLAGAKNLGVTHITNGCYRLHPVEWNVGEAVGELAAFCLSRRVGPERVAGDEALLWSFQKQLVASGIPLFWFTDVPLEHPAFASVQRLAAAGALQASDDHLLFEPDEIMGQDDALVLRQRAEVGKDTIPTGVTRAEATARVQDRLDTDGNS